MELLLLLVENRERLVTRDEIAERLWKGEVFVDTEHGINTAVRKIRTVLRDDPDNPRFVQTVTGKGYRFIAPVDKEPRKEAASPVRETAEVADATVTLPAERGATGSVTPEESKVPRRQGYNVWLYSLAAVAAVAAIALVYLGRRTLADRLLHREQAASIASIAVLPLDNLSGDKSQDYFADGMTDELITQLARDSTLRVTSRTSVMQYKGAHRPLREIASALNVDAIVEGSVERNGKQVHMTLQLIAADTDSHLWAESYDRGNNDTSTLPDEAARAIAARLKRTASSLAPIRHVNPEAHDDYLRGHYMWMVNRNKESGEYFQKAVDIDPDYAEGWAGLSEYLAVEALLTGRDPSEALAASEAAAHKAVELDGSLAHGHIDMGAALLFSHWDTGGALTELDRATELDPQNAQAYHLKAKILCALDRFDEANAVQAQSTAANAFEHPGARAEIFACTRQYDAAIQDAQLRLRDFPTGQDLLDDLAEAYHWTGHDKEAVEMLSREFAAMGDQEISKSLRTAYAEGGYHAVVQRELAFYEQSQRKNGDVSPVILARFHAMLGDREAAIRELAEAVNERAPLLVFRMNNPGFDSLHNDPRFRAIAQKVGIPYEAPAAGGN